MIWFFSDRLVLQSPQLVLMMLAILIWLKLVLLLVFEVQFLMRMTLFFSSYLVL